MSPDDDAVPASTPPGTSAGIPPVPPPAPVRPESSAAPLAGSAGAPPRAARESWRLPRRTGTYLTGTAGPRRLVGLDAARGLAMLGMMAAHVGYTTCGFTTVAGALHVTHGRSSILFAVIAGFSLGIISGREHPHRGDRLVRTRLRVLARSALLLVVAAVLQLVQTPVAIIIGSYAAWLTLAVPFLRWSPRRLFALAAATALLGPVLNLNLVAALGTVGLSPGSPWGGSANGALLEFFFTGAYPGITWMAFIFLGLGLSRLGWSTARQALRLGVAGAACMVLGYGGAWALASVVAPEARPSFVWVTPDDALECFLPAADEGGDLAALPGVGGEGTGPSSASGGRSGVGLGVSATGPEGAGTAGAHPASWGSLGGSPTTAPEPSSSSTTWPDLDQPPGGEERETGPQWSPELQSWAPLEALLSLDPHSGTPFEVVGGAGVAMLAIAGCLLLAGAAGGRGRWLLTPLAGVGSMSLTVYSGHIAAIWVLGLDVVPTGNAVLGWMALVCVVGALAWFLVFARGPLEHVIHVVSVRATQGESS